MRGTDRTAESAARPSLAGCYPAILLTLSYAHTNTHARRFAAWLHAAIFEHAPADAPWMSWKQDALHLAVDDLLSASSFDNLQLFKKRLKMLCGGKKKGSSGVAPARQ